MTVHQLKVTLRHVKPPVWRRIVVESDLTLAALAAVLEPAMGWLGGHLHVLDVGGTRYGRPDPDWGMDDLDENQFRLDKVLPKVGMKMRWDYDFGDGWEHDVLVEAINPPEPGCDLSHLPGGSARMPARGLWRPMGVRRSVGGSRQPRSSPARGIARVDAARLRPGPLRPGRD